jgi:Papain family cysteine protease
MSEAISRGSFVASAFATVVSVTQPPALKRPAGKRRGRGALLRASDFANGPQPADPGTLAGTAFARRNGPPPNAYTLPDLPPVVDQGSINSCCAHAFGYGLGGYTAAKAHGTSVTDPANFPSRAWLFANEMLADNRVTNCTTAGTYPLGYLEQLVSIGAPTEKDVPYQEDCGYIVGLQRNLHDYAPQSGLRIGSYRTLLITPKAASRQLLLLKAHLANGQIVAFMGAFGNDYQNPALRGGVYYGDAGFGSDQHAQLLVGYDDTKGQNGAFLVQNSYGTAWPSAQPGGRIWWDYHAFFRSQSCVAFALPARTGPPQGRPLHASLANAPAARIVSVHRAPAGQGSHELVLVHEFDEPVTLQHITVMPPKGPPRASATTMKVSNGYSLIPSPTPWRSKLPYALKIQVKTAAGQAVTYTGTIRV